YLEVKTSLRDGTMIAKHYFRAASTIARHICYCTCLIFFNLGASQSVLGQPAYLDGDNVYLPVVEDYEHSYSLQLRMLRGTFPIEFVLTHTKSAEGPVVASSAWYDGNVLIVPEVWIKGVSYWAELRELTN